MDLSFPVSGTFDENVELWAFHFEVCTEEGHGMFFDFRAAPEYERPVIGLLKERGWILERPYFIRRQGSGFN